jgi:3-hydroxybutyryl-CoA dehydrogenase/3-hydroxyacyl-CoA dehydrogenase
MSEAVRIGVVGAGVMGSGIAQVTAMAGYPIVCIDLDPAAVERGRANVTSGRYGLARAVERGKATQDAADAALARLEFSTSFDDAANADVVVEAVPERLDLKIRVFRDLDRAAPTGAILATNTSGFSVAAIAAATDRPDRVIGWHWASPAPVMLFAEIVRTRETSAETIAVVTELATACGKNPVVVNDLDTKWGFVANRIYGAVIDEAKRVVDDGVATPEQVDQLMMDCFAWPTGPYTMIRGATEGWTS